LTKTDKSIKGRPLCCDKTIKRWLAVLESLYVVFQVPPFHKNIARAILKSQKYYFYDTGQVPDDTGMKLENCVACSLLKEIHFREDCLGEKRNLYYLRNKGGREIDFLVTSNDKPWHMIEVKWGDGARSPDFVFFQKYVAETKKNSDCQGALPGKDMARRHRNTKGAKLAV